MDATRPAPTDNLVRLWANPVAAELRATSDGKGNTLTGHFAVFDTWTEINSMFEGNFLERIAPGAFKDTFAARGEQIRVLYDHGMDPTIGNKPLGVPKVLREDKVGGYYEVDLFDATYVNDLKPALRAGALGASFRFSVTGDQWNNEPEPSGQNPKGLPERTITGVNLYEFGPVTFPAYAEASAGLRSGSDQFIERLLSDPILVARLTERAGLKVAERIIGAATAAVEQSADDVPDEVIKDRSDAADGPEDVDEEAAKRRQWLASRFHISPQEQL